jgi:hypothetical protein
MIIQNRDEAPTRKPEHPQVCMNKHQGYYAVVPADLLGYEHTIIDELISFAFDTLGVWRLEVRVFDETAAKALVEA